MNCKDHIQKIMKETGPLSFRDYMNIALYDPAYGYYTSKVNHIGPDGDYYTSPYNSNLFGELIAEQIAEMANYIAGKPFSIIEYGGNNGKLCKNILDHLEKKYPVLYKNIDYYLIDPSIKQPFPFYHEKVQWMNSGESLHHLNGCVLSNELIDNMPVHLVQMNHELMEIFLDADENTFKEVLLPASDNLKNYLQELNINLPRGFIAEINLDVLDWLQQVNKVLDKGFVLTIDYGFDSKELYSDKRREGTIVCYHRHQTHNNPYFNPGNNDITAQVNFSALIHWGEKAGLILTGYTNQNYFLRALGLSHRLQKYNYSRNHRQGEQLLNDFTGKFGRTMKVLVQQKKMEPVNLKGLMFGTNNSLHALDALVC